MLVAVELLGMPAAAWGQRLPDRRAEPGAVPVGVFSATPRTFGTANVIAHVIGAAEFDPLFAPWGYVALTKFSSNQMVASVRLPAGAVVDSVEMEACDSNAAAQLTVAMTRRPSPSGPFSFVTATGLTGLTETPGCGFLTVAPLPAESPLVIDNENNTYAILVAATTATTSLVAVRVYYRLQVSPAPGVATFSDVPTSHPFFQFVEALARSGITSGCGGGNYCPDAPLTRGQMAVLLSLGLGLHFAP
jgi:hypothetical protein